MEQIVSCKCAIPGLGRGDVDYHIHFPAQSDSFQVLNYALSYRTTACEQGLMYSPVITTAKLFKSNSM